MGLAAGQNGGARDIREGLIPIVPRVADLGSAISTLAVLLVLIGLYVLANFGERSRTPRILTLIAGGVLSGLALVGGTMIGVIQPLRYNVGRVDAAPLRDAIEIGSFIAFGGPLGPP